MSARSSARPVRSTSAAPRECWSTTAVRSSIERRQERTTYRAPSPRSSPTSTLRSSTVNSPLSEATTAATCSPYTRRSLRPPRDLLLPVPGTVVADAQEPGPAGRPLGFSTLGCHDATLDEVLALASRHECAHV